MIPDYCSQKGEVGDRYGTGARALGERKVLRYGSQRGTRVLPNPVSAAISTCRRNFQNPDQPTKALFPQAPEHWTNNLSRL